MKRSMTIIYKTILLLSAVALITSCSLFRPDIQQGNFITLKEVNQLKTGMSKREVRFIMGTPLIIDPFQSDQRWDYFYSFRSSKKQNIDQRRVTLLFSGDQLEQILGNVENQPFGEAVDEQGGTRVDTPAQKEGFFKRLLKRIKNED